MNNPPPTDDVPPSLRLWTDLLVAFGGAADEAARRASRATFRAIDRRSGGKALPNAAELTAAEDALRPTPMWDLLSSELNKALQKNGARARLARYLGIPRQRITDFVKSRRTPDAETTLRLLHWLSAVHAGRDPSYLLPPPTTDTPATANPEPV